MKDVNKKILLSTIVGVTFLILLIVGTAYAYFEVNTRYDFSASASATTPEVGSVVLRGTGKTLSMDLTRVDMMSENADIYYASFNGKTKTPTEEVIGVASVDGEGTYTCSYTIKIDDNSNSIYDKFQNMTGKSNGQIVMTVNGVDYDFNTSNLFPKSISGTLNGITENTPQNITAGLKFVNSNTIDQSVLINSSITLSFTTESFSCEAKEDNSLILDYFLANNSENLSTELVGGLYRYQGITDVVDNNYICFGTSDMNTCKTNPDTYMYRIIGINPEGKLKLIKMTELDDEGMQWYTDRETDITWPESYIYQNLNGSKFLNNTTYIPSGWLNKIADTEWQHGYMTMDDFGITIDAQGMWKLEVMSLTGNDYYNVESKLSNKITSKIGLMYVHDFYYQLTTGTCNINFETETGECQNGWLNLLNNDLTPSDYYGYEWFMTYYGNFMLLDTYDSFIADSDSGSINLIFQDEFNGVRPVFYLKTDITITNGNGTIDFPFIIE